MKIHQATRMLLAASAVVALTRAAETDKIEIFAYTSEVVLSGSSSATPELLADLSREYVQDFNAASIEDEKEAGLPYEILLSSMVINMNDPQSLSGTAVQVGTFLGSCKGSGFEKEQAALTIEGVARRHARVAEYRRRKEAAMIRRKGQARKLMEEPSADLDIVSLTPVALSNSDTTVLEAANADVSVDELQDRLDRASETLRAAEASVDKTKKELRLAKRDRDRIAADDLEARANRDTEIEIIRSRLQGLEEEASSLREIARARNIDLRDARRNSRKQNRIARQPEVRLGTVFDKAILQRVIDLARERNRARNAARNAM